MLGLFTFLVESHNYLNFKKYTMELNEKILKSIKESLPELTANELKDFIEQANRDKKELESAKKTNAEAVALINKYKEQESTFLKAAEIKLAGEKALSIAGNKERQLSLDIKDEQIKQRDFVISKFDGFLNNLVKNPRAIEIISQHGNIPVSIGPSQLSQSQPFHSTTTSIRDETKD
jgi:hypothetical protein